MEEDQFPSDQHLSPYEKLAAEVLKQSINIAIRNPDDYSNMWWLSTVGISWLHLIFGYDQQVLMEKISRLRTEKGVKKHKKRTKSALQ